jgi:hypothetical protein
MRQLRATIAPHTTRLRLWAVSSVAALVIAHQAAHTFIPGFSCFRYH